MIKTKVPEPVQEAMLALRPNEKFKIILRWLEESLEATRIQNDDLSGEDLTRNQGCAKTLTKILNTANGGD